MARSVNRVTLIGNVGADPEIRTTGAGVKVARVSLATNEVWNDRDGQKQERTEWHRLTFWDKLADVVEQYVKKGDRMYAEGALKYSTTDDGKGNVKYYTDITVREMVMLGGAGGGGDEQTPRQQKQAAAAKPARKKVVPAGGGKAKTPSPFDADDDDLPF
jgi:single-strand DNA-binding protein